MNKKILVLILTTIFSISLLGCKNSSNKEISSNYESSVVSTDDNNVNDLEEKNLDTSEQTEDFDDLENSEEDTLIQDFTTGNLTIKYSQSVWSEYETDDYELCLLGKNNSIFNIVTESMQGLSEEEYNKASDLDVHVNLGIDSIYAQEEYFNGNKARLTKYYQYNDDIVIPTYQVTFLNNGHSYIFTLMARDEIDDELMSEFTSILNTVTFN